jgi:hypothetical protein
LTGKKVHLKNKTNGMGLARECIKCCSAREIICSGKAPQLQENQGDGADHKRVARQSDGGEFSNDGARRRSGEKILRPILLNASGWLERGHAG